MFEIRTSRCYHNNIDCLLAMVLLSCCYINIFNPDYLHFVLLIININ